MTRRWILFLSFLLGCTGGCGMTVKVEALTKEKYPENAATDLTFYVDAMEWMKPVVVIGVQGANYDRYMEIRRRACEVAAKHGCEAILVLKEIRAGGDWYVSDVQQAAFYNVVTYTQAWRPDCLYLGVRHGMTKEAEK